MLSYFLNKCSHTRLLKCFVLQHSVIKTKHLKSLVWCVVRGFEWVKILCFSLNVISSLQQKWINFSVKFKEIPNFYVTCKVVFMNFFIWGGSRGRRSSLSFSNQTKYVDMFMLYKQDLTLYNQAVSSKWTKRRY